MGYRGSKLTCFFVVPKGSAGNSMKPSFACPLMAKMLLCLRHELTLTFCPQMFSYSDEISSSTIFIALVVQYIWSRNLKFIPISITADSLPPQLQREDWVVISKVNCLHGLQERLQEGWAQFFTTSQGQGKQVFTRTFFFNQSARWVAIFLPTSS